MEDRIYYNTRAIMQIQEQAQELGMQANETLKKVETMKDRREEMNDSEIVQLVIYNHEQSEYEKEDYEIISEDVKSVSNGEGKEVKVCYIDNKDNSVAIINAYVDLVGWKRVKSYNVMYVSHKMINLMYQAVDGRG